MLGVKRKIDQVVEAPASSKVFKVPAQMLAEQANFTVAFDSPAIHDFLFKICRHKSSNAIEFLWFYSLH